MTFSVITYVFKAISIGTPGWNRTKMKYAHNFNYEYINNLIKTSKYTEIVEAIHVVAFKTLCATSGDQRKPTPHPKSTLFMKLLAQLVTKINWLTYQPSTLTPVCILSILFSTLFLGCWQGEFVQQSRAPFVGDHFLYSHDLKVRCRVDILRRS